MSAVTLTSVPASDARKVGEGAFMMDTLSRNGYIPLFSFLPPSPLSPLSFKKMNFFFFFFVPIDVHVVCFEEELSSLNVIYQLLLTLTNFQGR